LQKLDKSKLTKGLLNNYKLVPHLDLAIQKLGDFEWSYQHEIKKGDEAFHPSSHCLPSALEIYQSVFDQTEDNISGSLYKTFQVGHFWHSYLYTVICDHLQFADWADVECPGTRVWGMNGDGSPKPFHFSQGKADIARCSIPKHGDYLIDFKTMNQIDFRTPGLPQRFHYKYVAQANIYMDWFDLDRALIVKIQKDSPHDFAEVEIHRNQVLIDMIYEKWKFTSLFIAEKTPPPTDEELGDTFRLPFV
jgi:hypothetical protein